LFIGTYSTQRFERHATRDERDRIRDDRERPP
jgi:hypothetical protein